jgi:transketolase
VGEGEDVREAFANTMLKVGQEDEKLVVLVGDISHNILQPFAKACPGRYYNVGIMEPTIVGMAAGLSMAGLRPVVHTIAPFLIERSFEQIKLDFGYQKLGGVLVSVGGAFDYAGLGCSHHTYMDCALIKSIEGSVVVCPASPTEFSELFKAVYKGGLSYFRLSERHGEDFPVELGKAVKVKDGNRITIVAVGPQLKTALEADVPGAEIIYVHTLKPLDVYTLAESYNKTGRLFVLEEHSRIGNLMQELVGWKVSGINIPDRFQRGYGSRQDHLNHMGFTPQVVRELCRA